MDRTKKKFPGYAVMIGARIIGTVATKSASAINKVLADYTRESKKIRIGKISVGKKGR